MSPLAGYLEKLAHPLVWFSLWPLSERGPFAIAADTETGPAAILLFVQIHLPASSAGLRPSVTA